MSLNIALLSETFQRAKHENGGLTALGMRFYERLFEKYPAVKPLFNTPPAEQHKKLMASLGAIVGSATAPERMTAYVRAMGIRHLKYGTLPAHYPAVAENLMAVLGEHLSKEGEWTPDMAQCWNDALSAVAGAMIDAAEHADKYKDELAEHGYLPDGFKAKSGEPWLMESSIA